LPGGCGIRFFTTENLVHYLLKERKIQMNVKTFECHLFYAYGIRRKGMQMLCRQLFILMHAESFSVVS
jgi:hypothetical protein